MRSHIGIGAAALALLSVLVMAPAQDSAASEQDKAHSQNPTPKAFVQKATIAGLFEIKSGVVAQAKAREPRLKGFADRMIRDHTAANESLSDLVQAGKVEGVQSVPTSLDATHSRKLSDLRSASERDFDRMYRRVQVKAHEDAITLFEAESKSGNDPELAAWASTTLPILKQHLNLAKSIAVSPSTASAENDAPDGGISLTGKRKSVQKLVVSAIGVVRKMKKDPKVAGLIEKAKGIFIVPDFTGAAFGLGIRNGEGVLLVQRNGAWSAPAFYGTGAISVGAQAGAMSGSIVYLLMSDDAVAKFNDRNSFSLNAAAGLSVVAYSADAEDSLGKGDVIVWAETRGLFAGVAVGLSDIIWDAENNMLYRGPAVTPGKVLKASDPRYSESQQLAKVLALRTGWSIRP